VTDAEHDDRDIVFPLNPIEGETPPELSTGNPDDDQLLRQIAARVPLDQPRAWALNIAAVNAPTAEVVARLMARMAFGGAGFEFEICAPEAEGEPYYVTAVGEATVLTADLVRSSREVIEIITSNVPGTVYDGWEVALDPDEILAAMPTSDNPGGSQETASLSGKVAAVGIAPHYPR
jgi:hypothetical protein